MTHKDPCGKGAIVPSTLNRGIRWRRVAV